MSYIPKCVSASGKQTIRLKSYKGYHPLTPNGHEQIAHGLKQEFNPTVMKGKKKSEIRRIPKNA